jgi:peptide/nickel transport system permease protein
MGVAAAFGLGLMIGVFSGVSGGRTEQAIMRLCELVMSVPAFFLMLALRAVFP